MTKIPVKIIGWIGQVWQRRVGAGSVDESRQTLGFTLIELIVASLIVSVVMLIAWSGLISLMNMSAMAEARSLRQVEINRALDFLTDELRTARYVNATANHRVDGTMDIADLLTAEGFNLNDLGDYGDLALYLEIPTPKDPPTDCPTDGPNPGQPPPSPSTFDRVIYDVRDSSSEWLGPRTLMRYGRIKDIDGSFDPCESPIASDPIADALAENASQVPTCSGTQTGGSGFYACQDENRTNLTFQHTLVNTSVIEVAGSATSRLQSIQPNTLANVGCQNKKSLKALSSDRPARLRVLNQRSSAIKIHAIDTAGVPQTSETIPADSTWETSTFYTHPWVIQADADDQCLSVYVIDGADNLAILPPQKGGGNDAVSTSEEVDD